MTYKSLLEHGKASFFFSVAGIRDGTTEYLTLKLVLKEVQVFNRMSRKDGRGIMYAKTEECRHALHVLVMASSSVWRKLGKAVYSQVERVLLPK